MENIYNKMRRRRRENIKIVEEGMKNGEAKRSKKRKLVFFDYFNRFLSNRCVFDSFCHWLLINFFITVSRV